MRCGAFVDRNRIPQYTEQDFNLPETPPFSWLLRKTKSDAENKTDDEKLSKSQNDENSSPNNNGLSSRIAEASKLSQSPKDNLSGTSPSSLKSRWSVRENKEDDKLLKELVSFDNKKVKQFYLMSFNLQHFPFANQSTPIGDLARFYRECFNAPPLESFATVETDPTFDDVEHETTVDDLTRQLAEFETSMNDFDGLITSLCEESETQCNS